MQPVLLLAFASLAALVSCEEALDFEAVSVLGLQRSITITRRQPAPIEDRPSIKHTEATTGIPAVCTSGTPVVIDGKQYLTKFTVIKPAKAGAATITKFGTKVSAKVKGALAANGKVFWDSTNACPFPPCPDFDYVYAQPSKAQDIIGFDVGSYGMKQGETRQLCIPPSEGYGSKTGNPAIPANSTLVFTLTCDKVGGSTTKTELSFEDVSVLGLQRSTKLSRRSAPVEEDEQDDGLTFEDVSVLGLQRSVQIVRRQAVKEDNHEAREKAALSVLEV